MAHLLWRKRNLPTFRKVEFARRRMTQIRDAIVSETEELKSDGSVEFERTFIEKCHTAETQGRNELGELYALVEIGEEATIDGLMKELEVQERLDAMIDKCLKRLLFLKGVPVITCATSYGVAEGAVTGK